MKEVYIISSLIICAGMIFAWNSGYKMGYEARKIDEEEEKATKEEEEMV
jgi:hypothetical protein